MKKNYMSAGVSQPSLTAGGVDDHRYKEEVTMPDTKGIVERVAEVVKKNVWIFFDSDGSGNINASTSKIEGINQAAAEIVAEIRKVGEEYIKELEPSYKAELRIQTVKELMRRLT